VENPVALSGDFRAQIQWGTVGCREYDQGGQSPAGGPGGEGGGLIFPQHITDQAGDQ